MESNRQRSTKWIVFLLFLFVISAFCLLSIRTGKIDIVALVMGAGVAVYNLAFYNILKMIYRGIDRFVILVAEFLWSVGLIMIYRISPNHAVKQCIILIFSTVAMIVAMMVVKNSSNFGRWNYFFMVTTVLLLGSTLVLSRAVSGAKNWIDLGFIQVQPSEFAKILFALVSAYYFSTADGVLKLLPYIAYTALCVILLVIARELGTALLLCGVFLVVFFVATGKTLLTILGIGVFGVGAVASYKLFSHVRTRVQIWRDPWATYNGQGYQIVQGLLALASGGLFGTGLGKGRPDVIPASRTDYIFSVIGEEFGIIFATALIVFYLVFIVRGILIALNSDNKYDAILVFACTSMLSLQSFIIIGGVIKLIPLTGITLPFISYGGSSFLTSMIQLGIIEGVSIKNTGREDEEIQMMGEDIV